MKLSVTFIVFLSLFIRSLQIPTNFGNRNARSSSTQGRPTRPRRKVSKLYIFAKPKLSISDFVSSADSFRNQNTEQNSWQNRVTPLVNIARRTESSQPRNSIGSATKSFVSEATDLDKTDLLKKRNEVLSTTSRTTPTTTKVSESTSNADRRRGNSQSKTLNYNPPPNYPTTTPKARSSSNRAPNAFSLFESQGTSFSQFISNANNFRNQLTSTTNNQTPQASTSYNRPAIYSLLPTTFTVPTTSSYRNDQAFKTGEMNPTAHDLGDSGAVTTAMQVTSPESRTTDTLRNNQDTTTAKTQSQDSYKYAIEVSEGSTPLKQESTTVSITESKLVTSRKFVSSARVDNTKSQERVSKVPAVAGTTAVPLNKLLELFLLSKPKLSISEFISSVNNFGNDNEESEESSLSSLGWTTTSTISSTSTTDSSNQVINNRKSQHSDAKETEAAASTRLVTSDKTSPAISNHQDSPLSYEYYEYATEATEYENVELWEYEKTTAGTIHPTLTRIHQVIRSNYTIGSTKPENNLQLKSSPTEPVEATTTPQKRQSKWFLLSKPKSSVTNFLSSVDDFKNQLNSNQKHSGNLLNRPKTKSALPTTPFPSTTSSAYDYDYATEASDYDQSSWWESENDLPNPEQTTAFPTISKFMEKLLNISKTDNKPNAGSSDLVNQRLTKSRKTATEPVATAKSLPVTTTTVAKEVKRKTETNFDTTLASTTTSKAAIPYLIAKATPAQNYDTTAENSRAKNKINSHQNVQRQDSHATPNDTLIKTTLLQNQNLIPSSSRAPSYYNYEYTDEDRDYEHDDLWEYDSTTTTSTTTTTKTTPQFFVPQADKVFQKPKLVSNIFTSTTLTTTTENKSNKWLLFSNSRSSYGDFLSSANEYRKQEPRKKAESNNQQTLVITSTTIPTSTQFSHISSISVTTTRPPKTQSSISEKPGIRHTQEENLVTDHANSIVKTITGNYQQDINSNLLPHLYHRYTTTVGSSEDLWKRKSTTISTTQRTRPRSPAPPQNRESEWFPFSNSRSSYRQFISRANNHKNQHPFRSYQQPSPAPSVATHESRSSRTINNYIHTTPYPDRKRATETGQNIEEDRKNKNERNQNPAKFMRAQKYIPNFADLINRINQASTRKEIPPTPTTLAPTTTTPRRRRKRITKWYLSARPPSSVGDFISSANNHKNQQGGNSPQNNQRPVNYAATTRRTTVPRSQESPFFVIPTHSTYGPESTTESKYNQPTRYWQNENRIPTNAQRTTTKPTPTTRRPRIFSSNRPTVTQKIFSHRPRVHPPITKNTQSKFTNLSTGNTFIQCAKS